MENEAKKSEKEILEEKIRKLEKEILEEKVKKLEKEIADWRKIGTEKAIWLFVAVLGCYSIPIEQSWIRLLAMSIIIIIFLTELSKAVEKYKRKQPFLEDLRTLKGDISEKRYKRIEHQLTVCGILKDGYTMFLCLIFYAISLRALFL
jgi:hypothetical protein